MSCGECIEGQRQNTKGFKCCLGSTDDSFDVLRFDGSIIRCHKDNLVEEYEKYCQDRKQAFNDTKRLSYAGKYEYLEWIVRVQKICPHSIISRQSKYLIESVNYCQSDMSFSFPYPNRGLPEQPALFFEALQIINSKRAESREASRGRQKDSNKS